MGKWIANIIAWIGEWLHSHSKHGSPTPPIGLLQRFLKSRNSLSFTVIAFMVFLALLPVILVATGTYLRSRSFLQEQVTVQLENLVSSQSPQLNNISSNNHRYLTEMLSKDNIREAVDAILLNPSNAGARYIARAQLQTYIQSNALLSDTNVDAAFILGPDLTVLAASKTEWNDLDLSGTSVIKDIFGTSKTYSVFNPSSLYTNQWVTLSGRQLVSEKGGVLATMIIASLPPLPKTVLETTGSFFSEGKSYFVTSDGSLVGINPRSKQITQLPSASSHSEKIAEIFQRPTQQGFGQFDSPDLIPVFTYAKWLPELNIGVVIEVPTAVVFRQIDSLVPFTFLLLGISLIFISILVFIGSRSLVSPIIQLTNSARSFARGDWSERSSIHRRDEIGILASTFNQMVEQISDLYRSLEQKVEERSRQLRTASEVGQLATSASSRDEIIERAVKLVIDRFGYSFASIFILDQVGTSAVLQAAYSQSGEMKDQLGYRIVISPDSLVGWVGKHNRARVISDFSLSEFPYNGLIFSSSQSEVAIPISVGNHVLGIFEMQSTNPKGFEPESISVLQTICNQIANGLQNLRLLESTQINLEETNLLFRTSRQISLTKNENDMVQVLRESLVQTPYISGLFSVEEDYLGIIAITDPRNLGSTASTQGITLPLLRIPVLLEKQRQVIVDDLSRPTDYDVLLSFFSRRGCRSAAIFSIFDESRLTKILVLGSREPNPMTETALQAFASLMEVVGTTSQRFRILESLEDRVNTLQTLNKISQAISAKTDLGELFTTLNDQIHVAIGSDVGFLIALYNAKENLVEIPYVYEENTWVSIPSFPLGEGLTSHVILTHKPLMIVKDTERKALALGAKLVGKPAKSWLGVPLMLGNQVIGAMTVQDLNHEDRFTTNDLNLFQVLAPQVAVTIRNAQLLAEMRNALGAYDMERFLLNTLMDNIPDQVSFKDVDGQYIRVSQSYSRQLNQENPVVLIGKSDFDFMSPEMADSARRVEESIIANGEAILGDVEKQAVGRSNVWKLNSKIPMVNASGEKMGLLGISRDITELKNAEELAQLRATHLQFAAEVARDTSGTLETTQLLANAVNLIRDRFGFYHASIFLLDPLGEYAILRESTGEVGAQMKQRRHRLAVGSQSIVGQVTARKEPWVVNDVSLESLHYINPLLPETRSELAIPLIVGNRILGAIDVQSKIVDAFIPDEVKTLQLLADQIAIAVWNSILFGQSQETLAQHRLLHQISIAASSANTIGEALETTVKALHTASGGEQVMVLLLEQGKLRVRTAAGYEGVDFSSYTLSPGEGIQGMAFESRQPVRINDLPNHPEYAVIDTNIQSEMAVPIYFGDLTVGILDIASYQPGAYDETDQEILASLGNTLGAVIANAQLVREVRQQVDRQKMLYDITSRIRRTTDIQTILQISAREIARSLGAKRAHIEINVDQPGQAVKPFEKKPGGNGYRKDSGMEVIE